jgi:hypothetical protein
MVQRALLILLLFVPTLSWAEDPSALTVETLTKPHGSLAVWAILQLHFLGIMVVAGSSLLAFFIDSVGSLLGKHLGVGDALWKSLFSRLSVLLSLLGLAALGVSGAYPEAAGQWLHRFSPTFGVHVFFGVLGLASGYGVINSQGQGARLRDRQRANGAIAAVVFILAVGFVTTVMNKSVLAPGIYAGALVFLLPLLVLLCCRALNSTEGIRLTFEAIASLSFMILMSIASSWRGADLLHNSLENVLQQLTLQQSIFHGVAAVALVSLLELAWGQLNKSGGGALGQEFRRLGADHRWFLVTAVLALTTLPFSGYLSSAATTNGSWMLAFQGALAALTLLALNHEIWTRIELTKGPGASRTWLWALLFVFGLLVLLTPEEVPLLHGELQALAGQGNHPTLGLWGTAPLKHVAFGVLAMVSFDALLCMVRGEVFIQAPAARSQARFRAGIWAVGALVVGFLLFGFGALKGQSSLGSTFELLKIVTLEVDDKGLLKQIKGGRKAALEQVQVPAVPAIASGEPLFELLSKSNRLSIGAVSGAKDWAKGRQLVKPTRDQLVALRKAEKKLSTTALSQIEWELIWFDSQPLKRRAAGKHIALLAQCVRVQSAGRLLKSQYGLDEAGQAFLLRPLCLMVLAILVIALGTWFMSSHMGAWARGLELCFSLAALGFLFVTVHHIGCEPELTERFARTQHILLMGVMAHLAGMQLVSLWCGARVEVLEDPLLSASRGAGGRSRKVESLAALSFVFLLVLGGWGQSDLGISPVVERQAGEQDSLLFLIRSIDGFPLGTAIKSTFILGLSLIIFLSATRIFVWTQQASTDAQEAEDSALTLSQILPLAALLLLLLLYLASESGLIAFLFLGVLLLIVLIRQDWHEFPILAVLFAFCFLFVGIECSKWSVTRRQAMQSWETPGQGRSPR